MPFTLHPADTTNARRLADIDERAYATDPMRHTISTFRTTATPEQRAAHRDWAAAQLRQQLAADATSVAVQAVETASGVIAGWAEWKKPGFGVPGGAKPEESPLEVSPCVNVEAVEGFMRMYSGAMAKHMDGRNDYWCLAKLVVDPEFQRQGVGSLLLKQMLDSVDASGGADVYLGSPPSGVALFERHGFDVRERVAWLEGWEFAVMLRGAKTRAD